jgi:hypothetical protein
VHRWAVGFDGLMGGDQSGPRRRGRRADRPRGDGHAEAGQDRGAAGEAQPEPVVQPQPGGLGPRAELGPRRAQGIGGLLGVTALNAATTPAAAAYPHPEPGHHWTNRGQLGLELISPPLEVDPVTAVGATAPQRGIHGPVRVRGGHPVTMTAMGVAGLATRRAGSCSERPSRTGPLGACPTGGPAPAAPPAQRCAHHGSRPARPDPPPPPRDGPPLPPTRRRDQHLDSPQRQHTNTRAPRWTALSKYDRD